MRLDLEDMERKILDNKVKAFIFCSPHNPTGRVWDEDEIRDVAVLCGKYHVLLISDEIWADFTPGGKRGYNTGRIPCWEGCPWQNLWKTRYRALFWSTFRLSACTFGGATSLCP